MFVWCSDRLSKNTNVSAPFIRLFSLRMNSKKSPVTIDFSLARSATTCPVRFIAATTAIALNPNFYLSTTNPLAPARAQYRARS